MVFRGERLHNEPVDDSLEIPLFPLQTVLFPGGPLSLRIFEPRYLDMVSRCLREEHAFGVCLIRAGAETGPAEIVEVGTLARIVDWQPRDDGMLGIRVRGGDRFRLEQCWTQKDGLNVGRARSIAPDLPAPLPAEWRPLVPWLKRAIKTLAAHYSGVEADYEDARWVGFRLAEILPLPLPHRQVLLEMTSPLERLRMLWPLAQAARRKQ